jgi:hypothetical protein
MNFAITMKKVLANHHSTMYKAASHDVEGYIVE